MTVQIGWDIALLAVMVAALIFWLGALAEYLIHAWKHRRH